MVSLHPVNVIMSVNNLYEIIDMNWEKYPSFRIHKCYVNINLVDHVKFLENMHVIIKKIFYDDVLDVLRFNNMSKVGICIRTHSLEYPINIEFSKISDVNRKFLTIKDRLAKVAQSSKLSNINNCKVIFTFVNIRYA